MTSMESYFTQILDNEIPACYKMKKVSEMLLNNLYNPGEFHFDPTIAARHINFIESFCKLPSGKANTPLRLELYQRARFEAIFGFVDDNDLRQYNEVLIIEGRKNGKALSLDTEIPTPSGFKKMRYIHKGDEVFGEDGKAHTVTVESEVFKSHDCYRVTFRGGDSVICDADHIWRVRNHHGNYHDKKTSELLHFKRIRKDGKGTEYLYRIPVTQPVEYGYKELPIDPYTLGVWLGDGDASSTRITVSDEDAEEAMHNIELCGHTVKRYYNTNRPGAIGIDIVKKGNENKFLTSLRNLGVYKNKHIPEEYLSASVNQRMELLQGMMDTDGYCDKAGQCEFCQKDEKIIDQFRELLSSLGIISSKREKTIRINGKECHAYSVLFFVDKSRSCFRLKRKHERLKDKLQDRMNMVDIIDIQPVDSVDCKCIAIDSESHLYLASRNYIVTHNTTETAAVELDLLMNDKEYSPQIYNVATMLDQAKLGFNACHKMVMQSKLLSKHIRKREADLYFSLNHGFIKALASNSNSLDGLDTHGATIDELAAIKNRDIYDLVRQSTGARSQSLIFTISTNGFVRDGIFDAQYEYASSILEGTAVNRRFLPFIYELDDPSEWEDESCWMKANPGLGTVKSIDYLREMVQKAKDDPQFKPTVLVKDFNLKQTGATSWLRWEDLDNKEAFPDHPFRYCIGGFDAADTTDLNAAKILCMRPGDPKIYVKSMYWLPKRVLDEWEEQGKRQGRDNVPYWLWRDKGLLRVVDGYKVDKHVILDWFREVVEQDDIWIKYIGYDPWHIDDSLERDFKNEFGENTMIKVRQGTQTLSGPMKDLKADLKAGMIVYDNNPIDKWCLANTAVKVDINDNIQPVKTDDSRKRIDGTMALLDAYVVLQDKMDEYQACI